MAKTTETPVSELAELAAERRRVLADIDARMVPHLVQARLERCFPEAVKASGLSATAALRLTREYNERAGRSIRWSDGLDPTSTAHSA